MNKLIDLEVKAVRAEEIKSVSKIGLLNFKVSKNAFKILISLYTNEQIQLEYENEEKRDLKYKEIVSIVNECSSDKV